MIPDNRVTQFHPGQVWETSRGALHRVMEIKNGQAVFKAGSDGSGRITRKQWDAVENWVLAGDPLHPKEYPIGQIKRRTYLDE